MLTIIISTAPIWISCLSAYVFYKLDYKEKQTCTKYYFSRELFDRHLSTPDNKNMSTLWEEELKHNLP